MFQKTSVFIIILFLVLLEVSFLPYLFSDFAPDLVLILIIFLSAREGFNKIWPIAVTAGILVDLFFFQTIGMQVIIYSLIAFGVGSLAKRFLVEHKLWGIFTILFLVVMGTIINSLALDFREKVFSGEYFLYKSLVNAAAFITLYVPMRKLEKMLGRYREPKLIIK